MTSKKETFILILSEDRTDFMVAVTGIRPTVAGKLIRKGKKIISGWLWAVGGLGWLRTMLPSKSF